MGTLRFLLAFAVLLSHTYDEYILTGGRLAVQMFYIISGFLISYILIEAKSYVNIRSFYINRILRLFPAYYFVSFLTLLYFYYLSFSTKVPFFDIFENIDLLGKIYLIFSNFFILGQDLAFFSAINGGQFKLSYNYSSTEILVYEGLINQISWTLSLEMMFYLVAPFILGTRWLLLGLLTLSIMFRLTLLYFGLEMYGGFYYRFFPLELGLFILGSLSHQILRPLYNSVFKNKMNDLSIYVTCLLLIFCLIFSLLPIVTFTFIMLAVLIMALPFLFHFQNIIKWDRYLGRYSYPIYISQFPIMVFVGQLKNQNADVLVFVAVILTFLLSLIIEHLIHPIVERKRLTFKN